MTTVRDHRAEGAATTAARPVAPRTALGRITRAAGATILIAATLLAISSSWAAGTARALNTTEASQPTIAADVIKRINIERKARGLYEFTVDPELSASAQSWAEHLRDTGTFQHSDSPGETLTTMGDSAGVDNQWMRSEGHRQQILTSTETRIGIGVACDSNGNGVVVGHYAGDTGVYNVYQAQDPINGVNFEPDYTCVRPKSSTTTTQSPPTTQKSTTTTTQKPSSSTTQPTSPPPTQPQQSTTSTTKAPSGGGSTGTTQPSTPPTTAPPPPPPPPPGQATLAVTPAQSVAGQAATLAAAGACPSAGQNVVALVDGDGRARATGQTSRASFGGSSAVHLELKPSLPAGDYTVVLLCADNTQASVPHTRLPAGAPAPDPQAPASVVSSGGTGTPPTSADGTVLTTIPAPQLDTDHIRSVAAKDAAQLREQHTSSGSPVLPITAAGVATFGGIGALWFVHRRRALTAAKALIATP